MFVLFSPDVHQISVIAASTQKRLQLFSKLESNVHAKSLNVLFANIRPLCLAPKRLFMKGLSLSPKEFLNSKVQQIPGYQHIPRTRRRHL